jgi:predicted permease
MIHRLEMLLQDLRIAARTLRRRPAFSAAAVGTLALGFGANTAIFSIVNAVLLRPLGYHEPERLVRIDVAPDSPGGNPGSMSYPDIEDILARAPSLETLVGLNATRHTLTGQGDPEVLEVNRVTDGVLSTFQTAPVAGRDIRAEEFGEFTEGAAVLVISHAFWQNRFGGDANVLGRTVTLDGLPYEIVGVAPPDFDYPGGVAGWRPRFLNLDGCGRGCHTMRTIGRLAPGASVETLQAELDQVALRLEEAYPETNTNKRFLARSLHDFVVGDVRQGLLILMVSVVLVLLIACANVANLLLASAAAREGEIAVRAALGAGRRRLMSQVFAEGFALAGAGAAVGLGLAFACVSGFRTLAAGTIPRITEIAIDGPVLLWTLGGVIIVTFLFGLVPAFSVSRTAIGTVHVGQRAGTDRHTTRFRTALLAAEVGLSTTLLIGAGLLLRTFTELYRVDLGYETENIVRFRIGLPLSEYGSVGLDRVRTFYRTLEQQIAATPGVESVTSAFSPPLGSSSATGDVQVEGRPEARPGEEKTSSIHAVSPGYFETMRMPITQGRGFMESDDWGGDPVAVVSAAFVQDNFPGEDPIGKRFSITVDLGFGSPTWRIVGVTPDIRWRSLEQIAQPMTYVPHGQYGPEDMHVIVRSAANTPPVIPTVREVVRSLNPDVPLYSIETFDDVLRTQLAPTTLYLSLVGAFAVVAALLAAVGLYGVVSYIVSSRSREIGVRIALGAGRRRVVREILGRGMQPVLVGLVFGVILAAAAGQILESVLYGVNPRDPGTFLSAAVLLTVVAMSAITIPALRASRVSPASTLREE